MRLRVSPHTLHHKSISQISVTALCALSLAIGGALLFGSCDQRYPAGRQGDALCDTLSQYFALADASIGEAQWRSTDLENRGGLDSLSARRARWYEFLRSRNFAEDIGAWLEVIKDGQPKRRLWTARWKILTGEILHDTSLSRTVDSINAFAPVVFQQTVAKYRIDDSSNSRAHRDKAYRDRFSISTQLTEWTPRIVRLLNQKCQSLGYSSYLELELARDSLTMREVEFALNTIDSLSVMYYREVLDSILLRYRIQSAEAADLYFFAEHGPDSVQRILSRITRRKVFESFVENARDFSLNLTELGVFVDTSESTPSYGAPRVVIVSAPDDIRVALGPPAETIDLSYLTSFSLAMGRVLVALAGNHSDYLLQKYPGGLWETAVGMLIDELMFSQRSLAHIANVRGAEWSMFNRWLEMRRVITLRYTLLSVAFEIELFANPNREPLELYQTLFRKYLLVEPPDNYRQWSAEFWRYGIEAFRVNRLMGEALAAQISAQGFREIGDIAVSSQFGEFVRRRYLDPGARVSWRQLLQTVSGESMNLQYMIARYRPLLTGISN